MTLLQLLEGLLRLYEVFLFLLGAGAAPVFFEVLPFVEPPDTVARVSAQVVA